MERTYINEVQKETGSTVKVQGLSRTCATANIWPSSC